MSSDTSRVGVRRPGPATLVCHAQYRVKLETGGMKMTLQQLTFVRHAYSCKQKGFVTHTRKAVVNEPGIDQMNERVIVQAVKPMENVQSSG